MSKILFIDEYKNTVAGMANRTLLTPDGEFYSKPTIDNWEYKIPLFEEYQVTLGHLIYIEEIDFEWSENFRIYMMNKGYSKNSIAAYVSILKAFLKKQFNAKKTVYSGQGIRASIELTTAVYSTIDELKVLLKLDLSATPGIERVRDVYVMQCFLGLRISDMFSFVNDLKKNIRTVDDKKYFEIKTKKTTETVVIPAAKIVWQIAEKRNMDLGKMFSQQYYSLTIKSIIQMAGIDREVIFNRTEGGEKICRTVMYSDLLGTHTARRTFATNAYLMGLNPLDIMKITGHKTFNSFIKYIRCENMAVAVRISEHEFFNLNLLP